MKGQWIGKYEGDVSGNLMVNIDEVEDHFEGTALINPYDRNIPSSVAYIGTENKHPELRTKAFINPVDPRNGFQCRWEDIKDLFGEEVKHSNEADVSLKLIEDKLYIDALTDIGVVFKSVLEMPSKDNESKVSSQKMTWDEFKSYVSEFSESSYLYRGQKKPWRLCTSFHRRGRYRISKFIEKDVKQLHKRLSAITSHYFELTNPDQNGAFFNLLQHHGYPTPLLDWSYSPYVSAFFAFRDWPINYDGEGHSRIYIFNNEEWQKHYPQISNIDPTFPHLSVMEFIAINNPRIVPQQAVTTATNIDDIEAYVLERSLEAQIDFLQAVDIPARDREKAMMDLRFMGITAGSMFPGIVGVCEELRERNFVG